MLTLRDSGIVCPNTAIKAMLFVLFSSLVSVSTLAKIMAPEIPLSGFLGCELDQKSQIEVSNLGSPLGAARQSQLFIKVMSKQSEVVSACESIHFVDLPKPNHSPLVGPNKFDKVSELVNEYQAYYNGHEYISFVAPTEDQIGGTWILGNEPGVDSGYVFIKPDADYEGSSPIALESKNAIWHWLQKGKWVPQPQLKLACMISDLSKEKNTNKETQENLVSVYNIEYFDSETSDPFNSIIVVNPVQDTYDYIESRGAIDLRPEDLSSVTALWLDKRTERWIALKKINVIATLGGPSLITLSGLSNASSFIAHYVVDEHGGSGAWRLVFKRDRIINTIADGDSYLTLITLHGTNGFIAEPNIASIQSLKYANDVDPYVTQSIDRLNKVTRGEFLWLHYSMDESKQSIDELFLECVYDSANRAIFKYTVSDRREAMETKILTTDTDYVVMTRGSASLPTFTFRGSAVTVHNGFNLGNDAVGYIKNYLVTTEGFLSPSLSSCYFYHAAVSLPKALIYAAEILCVVIGAKPMTLIQYTSPSDHQWKHFLVRELSSKIVQAKLLLGDALNLEYRVTKYAKDETLVIYQRSRQYLFDSLLPANEAQALHPAPYPDRENPRPDEEKQIYFAWWNGFVLGYPEHFVDSYCKTFHNGLNENEKAVQAKRAKRDVFNHFRGLIDANKSHQHVFIKMGLDPSAPQEVWDMLSKK